MGLAFYSFFRFWLGPLAVLQRLPFLLIFGLGAVLLYPWIFVRPGHWLFYQYIRWMSRFFLLLNGVRIKADKAKINALQPGLFMLNYSRFVELAIIMWVFSYQKLIIMDPAFFSMKTFRSIMMNLGFAPRNERFSVKDYLTAPFEVDPYVQAGFSIIDCVDIDYQRDEVIPNSLVLSIKFKKPLHCFKFSGSFRLPYATLLTPIQIELTYLDTVPVNRRPELCLLNYDKVKFRYYDKD